MEGQSSTSRSGWGHHRGPVSTPPPGFSSGGKTEFLCLVSLRNPPTPTTENPLYWCYPQLMSPELVIHWVKQVCMFPSGGVIGNSRHSGIRGMKCNTTASASGPPYWLSCTSAAREKVEQQWPPPFFASNNKMKEKVQKKTKLEQVVWKGLKVLTLASYCNKHNFPLGSIKYFCFWLWLWADCSPEELFLFPRAGQSPWWRDSCHCSWGCYATMEGLPIDVQGCGNVKNTHSWTCQYKIPIKEVWVRH